VVVIAAVPPASDRLAATAGQIVSWTASTRGLRLVKSGRSSPGCARGAARRRRVAAPKAAAARPGMTEAECCAALEGRDIAAGGLTHYPLRWRHR